MTKSLGSSNKMSQETTEEKLRCNNLSSLFVLQTIDRNEDVCLNLYLQWRNVTEQEVSWPPVCTGAKGKLSSSFIFIIFFYYFIFYSKKTKFLCAVRMVPPCGLTLIFVFFFLINGKKQIPERGGGWQTSQVDAVFGKTEFAWRYK